MMNRFLSNRHRARFRSNWQLMKTCFKCHRALPLTEFYIHPKMADGHLNKCKECTKKEVADRLATKMKDPQWLEKERERSRLKMARIRREDREKKLPPEKRAQVQKAHRHKYPERDRARRLLTIAVREGRVIRKPCEVCGSTDSEGHHDDYSQPLQVRWLCPKHHSQRHLELRRLALAIQ